MTPELKAPSVTMPFDGFTQQAYEQKMFRGIFSDWAATVTYCANCMGIK